MLLRIFSSLRFTLVLLLGLALVAMIGTVRPATVGLPGAGEVARYDLFYQSPWFRLALGLLALNLAVCSFRTIRRNLGDLGRLLELLRSEQAPALPSGVVVAGTDLDRTATTLHRNRFRVKCEGGVLVARRGIVGRWGSTLVHLSLLLVMGGALAAGAGFVGTLNIYVGDRSAVVFDWDRQADRPLGFEFRLDRFEPIYYPIELRFAALDPQTGAILQTLTTREGETVPLPVPGMSARPVRFLPDEEKLSLEIFRDGRLLGEYVAFSGRRKEPFDNPVDPGVVLRPVAFRDPVLKQMRSEVSILEDGRVVRRGIIEINRPLHHRGVTIYQTAFSRDDVGFYYAGFQFSRDPGEGVVWGGCILLCLGLLCAFAVPYRALGVRQDGNRLLLFPLAGYGGEAGAALFARQQKILEAVSEEPVVRR